MIQKKSLNIPNNLCISRFKKSL